MKSMDVKTLEAFSQFMSLVDELPTWSRSTTCTNDKHEGEVCWIDWDDLLSLKIGIQNDDVPK